MQYINILWFLIIPVTNFCLGKMKIPFLHYISKGTKETQGPCLPGRKCPLSCIHIFRHWPGVTLLS